MGQGRMWRLLCTLHDSNRNRWKKESNYPITNSGKGQFAVGTMANFDENAVEAFGLPTRVLSSRFGGCDSR